jgi:hypothetical protein
MAIAYTKIKGQGAIESGYLKRIGSEDGYTSYQFYRIEAPYKEVQQGLFEQNEDAGEPLNVKLFIKDGVNLADISFNLRSMPGDNSKGYFKDSPHSLNLYIEEQTKLIEMDFSTAIIRKDGAVVEIHTNKGFNYDNRQDGDFLIDTKGELRFNTLFIKGNRDVSLEISNGAKINNFYCTMNSNVALFVKKSVKDLRFTSIAQKYYNKEPKDRFVFGIGGNGDVASFDGSREDETLENIHVRNVKFLARGHDSEVERTYQIGIESSIISFADIEIFCSYPEKLLNVKNNKALIPLDFCNSRSGGEFEFKGVEMYLGGSIYFDSDKVRARIMGSHPAPKILVRDSSDLLDMNFIKAREIVFAEGNETIIENAHINIDDGKGRLLFAYEKDKVINSKLIMSNVEEFRLSASNISNSYFLGRGGRASNDEGQVHFYFNKVNINNTKLVGCKIASGTSLNIKVTPKDKYDIIDEPLIELTHCDLVGVDEFNLELKGLEPGKIKQCGFVVENSNFNSKNVEITSYGNAKSKLSNIIFEKDFKILSINRNGDDGSSYEISNMILDDKVSFSVKGKASIENSVIDNLIVTSNRDLALKNSTIKRSNISGYTEISDVFVLDEVKKGSGKDRILLPITPEDRAKEVGEVNVEDVEIL